MAEDKDMLWSSWILFEPLNEPSREETNIVDPDQPKHAAQANPDRNVSPPADFLFQESLLITSSPPPSKTECVGPN